MNDTRTVCRACGEENGEHTGECRARQDAIALDMLAEALRLPEWRVNGSAAAFIDLVAEIVERRRDITGNAPEATLRDYGFDDVADKLYGSNEDDEDDEAAPTTFTYDALCGKAVPRTKRCEVCGEDCTEDSVFPVGSERDALAWIHAWWANDAGDHSAEVTA